MKTLILQVLLLILTTIGCIFYLRYNSKTEVTLSVRVYEKIVAGCFDICSDNSEVWSRKLKLENNSFNCICESKAEK